MDGAVWLNAGGQLHSSLFACRQFDRTARVHLEFSRTSDVKQISSDVMCPKYTFVVVVISPTDGRQRGRGGGGGGGRGGG